MIEIPFRAHVSPFDPLNLQLQPTLLKSKTAVHLVHDSRRTAGKVNRLVGGQFGKRMSGKGHGSPSDGC